MTLSALWGRPWQAYIKQSRESHDQLQLKLTIRASPTGITTDIFWDLYSSSLMYTANHSTHSFQLPYVQSEYSLSLSACASGPTPHASSRHSTPCPSRNAHMKSYESLRHFDPVLNTGPDGRSKLKRCTDSAKDRRSVLSFCSLRSLAVLLGKPRTFKSANAGLLD